MGDFTLMATNNFKAFALDPNANVISQADWEALPALLSGFTAGKASSAQVNKALRQSSFIAAALAQFVSDKNKADVLDDGDLSGFVADFISAIAVQSLSRTNPFSDIKSDGPEAIAQALSNLGIDTALAEKADLSDFSTSSTSQLLPNGKKFLWGNGRYESSDGSTGTVVSFPTAFPNTCYIVLANDGGTGVNRVSLTPIDKTSFRCWAKNTDTSYGTTNFKYLAIGD